MENKNKNIRLIRAAYDIIGALTPLENADCGDLCGKKCCKGDAAGMLLFPGEEIILGGVDGFTIEEFEYMDVSGMRLLMCAGKCDRNFRPLACRMFPCAPDFGDFDKGGCVSVQPDIRGRRMCPVWDLSRVDKNFTGAVKKAFELLAADGDMRALMRLIAAEIAELKRFYRK